MTHEARARRPVLAAIGSAGTIAPHVSALAEDLGANAVDAGFRIVSGGRDGVMEAFSRGGRHATRWTEGSVMGILMTYDDTQANPWLDIIIPTGIGFARNTLVVASADVVVAVAGGAGTLSEIALAWQLGKPVIALAPSGGWAEKMAGQQLDGRYARHIQCADSAEDAVAQALQWVQ